ncbi:MAG: PilZ domain-containing protein [Spirochaetes bacterium]|nr:PilZ domain-containing protein [Spirochaetota bacterium]MBU1079559.1 PilZ domain-containing protein [Spirochaetota bacterium]
MSIATSQQLTKYYETFRAISVTYTKEVVKSTGLQPPGVFLKCLGEQWPCVIYSSSFNEAKVLAPNRQSLMERISKANNLVSVRLSFKVSDAADPLLFYISGRISGFAPYAQSNGTLQFISIQFTQRPPDDFVEIIGRMLEANVNSARRKDDRILLTPDAMRTIGLARKESTVQIDGVPRKCILRDLSFTGAKVIIMGLAKFLVGKSCKLRVDLEDPRESIMIAGKVVRYEDVEGRKDLTAIALRFDDATIPMSYKMHLNDYLGQKKNQSDGEDGPEASKADSPPGRSG